MSNTSVTKKEIPPIPANLPESVRKRMGNLLQYKGKTRGPSKDKESQILTVTPMPLDVVKAEILAGREIEIPIITSENQKAIATIPITTEAILKKDELKVYVTEVMAWLESHPDWTLKEDLDDVYGLAMEKVIQYRLLLEKKIHPRADIERDFHSSSIRVQVYRQNLAARRVDRISGKGTKVINQTNIAIIASQMDAEKLDEMKRKIDRLNAEEDEAFQIKPIKENENGSSNSNMVSSNGSE